MLNNPYRMTLGPWRSRLFAVSAIAWIATGIAPGGDLGPASTIHPTLSIGDRVVLKDPEMSLRDGDRRVSNGGEAVFRVVGKFGEYVSLGPAGRSVRGWAACNEILPIEQAMSHYRRRLDRDTEKAQSYLAMGQVAIELGSWDEAWSAIDQSISLAPKNPAGHHLRGTLHAHRKELTEAITDYTEAIRLEPTRALAYHDRGLVWDRKRYFDNAISDITEAIRLEPSNIDLIRSRARVCSSHGRHLQAMDDLDRVIRLSPNDPAGYTARGEEWMEDLEAERAFADFTRALQIDPNYAPALISRGKTYKRKANHALALADYAEAVRRAPESALAHRTFAWALATTPVSEYRDGRRAVAEGIRACELTQYQDEDCINALAAAYAESGDYMTAVKWQARAMERLSKEDKKFIEFRRRKFVYETKHPYRD